METEQQIKHTPGPWRWEFNRSHRSIHLCGGRPMFDKTVMDFTRWGMQSAQPRFKDPNTGYIENAEMFAEVVPGREHHKAWFQTINQPDANLIAAAPDLLEALVWLRDQIPTLQGEISLFGMQKVHEAISKALAQ